MQPCVVLKRSRAIDEMALKLARPLIPAEPCCSKNDSSLDMANSFEASSVQLPSLEELTGGPAGADEPTLESLLDELDKIGFGSNNSNFEIDDFEQITMAASIPCDVATFQNAFCDHVLTEKSCVLEVIPNVEAQMQQPEIINDKEANLAPALTQEVQDGLKKTEEAELSLVGPCDAASAVNVVAELVLQNESAIDSEKNDNVSPVVEEREKISRAVLNIPQMKVPLKLPQEVKISSPPSSSDSSEEFDDAIHLDVSDDDEFFNM